MKKLRNAIYVLLILSLICFGIGGLTVGIYSLIKNEYSSPITVRYIAEQVIKNSEGHIYEYEYELKTEDNETIFWHSETPLEEQSKKFQIVYHTTKTRGSEVVTIVDYDEVKKDFETEEAIINLLKCFIVIFLGIELILIFLYGIMKSIIKEKEKKRQKEEEKKLEKRKLIGKYIPDVVKFINKEYPKYQNLANSFEEIARMLQKLDEFYQGREDEKEYINGLRLEIENIVHSYMKNITIDQQFKDQKVIKDEVHEKLENALLKFIFHIKSEISDLTSENDSQIYQELDKINSETELSGEAVKYLAEKYAKKN